MLIKNRLNLLLVLITGMLAATGCAPKQMVRIDSVVQMQKEQKDFRLSADRMEPVKCARVPQNIYPGTGSVSWKGKTYEVYSGSEICLRLTILGEGKQAIERDGIVLAEEPCYRCDKADDAFVIYSLAEERNVSKEVPLVLNKGYGEFNESILSVGDGAKTFNIKNVQIAIEENPEKYKIDDDGVSDGKVHFRITEISK